LPSIEPRNLPGKVGRGSSEKKKKCPAPPRPNPWGMDFFTEVGGCPKTPGLLLIPGAFLYGRVSILFHARQGDFTTRVKKPFQFIGGRQDTGLTEGLWTESFLAAGHPPRGEARWERWPAGFRFRAGRRAEKFCLVEGFASGLHGKAGNWLVISAKQVPAGLASFRPSTVQGPKDHRNWDRLQGTN